MSTCLGRVWAPWSRCPGACCRLTGWQVCGAAQLTWAVACGFRGSGPKGHPASMVHRTHGSFGAAPWIPAVAGHCYTYHAPSAQPCHSRRGEQVPPGKRSTHHSIASGSWVHTWRILEGSSKSFSSSGPTTSSLQSSETRRGLGKVRDEPGSNVLCGRAASWVVPMPVPVLPVRWHGHMARPSRAGPVPACVPAHPARALQRGHLLCCSHV